MRRRVRKGIEQMNRNNVDRDELQRLHQTDDDDDVNTDSDDYTANHQRV